jgi:hypothetical protein
MEGGWCFGSVRACPVITEARPRGRKEGGWGPAVGEPARWERAVPGVEYFTRLAA